MIRWSNANKNLLKPPILLIGKPQIRSDLAQDLVFWQEPTNGTDPMGCKRPAFSLACWVQENDDDKPIPPIPLVFALDLRGVYGCVQDVSQCCDCLIGSHQYPRTVPLVLIIDLIASIWPPKWICNYIYPILDPAFVWMVSNIRGKGSVVKLVMMMMMMNDDDDETVDGSAMYLPQ